MPRAAEHKQALVDAAAGSFRRRGYAATGLNDILSAAGAPKGSLYHYFPEGKEQLGVTAVKAGGITVAGTLSDLAASSRDAAGLVRGFADLLTGWLEASGYRDGCPISTVLLEMAGESEAIRAEGSRAYSTWRDIIGDKLVADGWTPRAARDMATHALCALEGALMVARVERSDAAIRAVASMLVKQMRAG